MANVTRKPIAPPTSQPSSSLNLPVNLRELESFNKFGVFYQRTIDSISPLEIQLNNTAIIQNQNRSFDRYFTDMKRRNHLKGIITTNLGRTYRLVDAGTSKTIDFEGLG